MATDHLSVDQFLIRLAALFESRCRSSHGSLFLTQKRLTPKDFPTANADSRPPPPVPFPDLYPQHPLSILIRATDGKSREKRRERVSLSTTVPAGQLEAFFVRYAEVWKAGMGSLKKRDRSGRKAKGKRARKRKEGGTGEEGTKIE